MKTEIIKINKKFSDAAISKQSRHIDKKLMELSNSGMSLIGIVLEMTNYIRKTT